MKKQLLTFCVLVSSCFFAYGQYDVGGVKVNVGQVQGTIGGNKVIVNPSTGQYQVTDANGQSVYVNGQGGVSVQAGGIGINYGNTQGNGASSGFSVGTCSLSGTGLLGLMKIASCFTSMLVPLLISLAVLAFFWFIVKFIWKGAEDPNEQKKAKAGMGWSLVALFAMVSVWGIIAFAGGILGIDQGGSIQGFKLPGEL
jgi:hypothetical protein